MLSLLPNYKHWIGSYCKKQTGYPIGVQYISDVITLVKDLGNQMPDKSWMLYLLEYFDRYRNVPVELNLFCEFDGQVYFEAIFNGVNQGYRFKQIPPIIGHSYKREIITNPKDRGITYKLTDLTAGLTDSYVVNERNLNAGSNQQERDRLIKKIKKIKFEAARHATCLEWHNRKEDLPFPIRYQVEISMLQYGLDPDGISVSPYDSLTPYKDDRSKSYPVTFQDIGLKNNCICYTINSGISHDGTAYDIQE